jgi:hypothetical protein
MAAAPPGDPFRGGHSVDPPGALAAQSEPPATEVYPARMDPAARPAEIRTLDGLAGKGPDELMALYKAACTPALDDLDGKLSGRMLAVPRAQAPHVRSWLDKFARSRLFPWQGKTFTHETANHGHGVNRLLGERVAWFRFHTYIGPSHAGEFDAVHLDYSHDGNPPLVRKVKDEVREVAPGLFLGLAYLSMKDGEHLGCFFGIAKT